jgi:hypothetical protein
MRSYKKKLLLSLFAGAAVVSITAIAALNTPNQNPPTSVQEQYDISNVPTTDYDKPEPSDLKKARLRQIRGGRFNLKDRNVDARRFAITEERQSGFGSFEIHAKPEPALPAAQSDAVVIGEVTDAEAFLSTDKTSIYSEFTVSVNEVLKGTSLGTLTPGGSLTATRGGGAVRFPSGKVVREGFNGKPLPRQGRRYVLFLKLNEEGQDFSIITAYELLGGRVSPLDGLYTTGQVVPQLAAHQAFKGVSEAAFLEAVRGAIAQSQSGADERR